MVTMGITRHPWKERNPYNMALAYEMAVGRACQACQDSEHIVQELGEKSPNTVNLDS